MNNIEKGHEKFIDLFDETEVEVVKNIYLQIKKHQNEEKRLKKILKNARFNPAVLVEEDKSGVLKYKYV